MSFASVEPGINLSPVVPGVNPPIKFGRTYQLTVTGQSGLPITLAFPLTLEFNITHHVFAEANTANLSIFGLSASHRRDIFFNQFLKSRVYPVVLNAGYISQQPSANLSPSSLPIIFNGAVNVAYTERSGPELVTRINAIDMYDLTTGQPPGYIAGGSKAYTAVRGTPFNVMVLKVMSFLTGGIKPGFVLVSNTPPPLTRDRVFTGNAWEILQQLASEANGAYVFVENGVCNMLGQNDYLPVSASLGTLSPASGLLNIPRYTGYTVEVTSVFEPSVRIGDQIGLFSIAEPWVNGQYKIVAYTHRGTISGVQSGECYTDMTLLSLSTPIGVAS